jgi:hypothetical protein
MITVFFFNRFDSHASQRCRNPLPGHASQGYLSTVPNGSSPQKMLKTCETAHFRRKLRFLCRKFRVGHAKFPGCRICLSNLSNRNFASQSHPCRIDWKDTVVEADASETQSSETRRKEQTWATDSQCSSRFHLLIRDRESEESDRKCRSDFNRLSASPHPTTTAVQWSATLSLELRPFRDFRA